jgi:hypothetical protein
MLSRSLTLTMSCAALAATWSFPASADEAMGPPVELSFPNPLAGCNDGFQPGGTWTLQDAVEPSVAVNPVNPKNIVALWMGGLQNIMTAASFDGGASWQRGALPLTVCAGGPYLAAGDVWLSFAPNGNLYASSLTANVLSAALLVVCKSTDGGLHWSAPVIVTSTDHPDHPSITADPTDARLAYVVWDEGTAARGLSIFSRTTDGGVTWETPRTLVEPPAQNGIQFSQILVLPDGTLVDLYEQFFSTATKKPITQTSLQVLRSTDHGQTWSAPINAVTMTPLYITSGPAIGFTLVVDPDTGQLVQDPTNPSFALDRANGNLYAVWEDGRFSNFQYNDIAFSMSADGGLTWSTPIRVNQTPLNIPPPDRQAFIPNIAVTDNGTIGVSYYDFRFNTPDGCASSNV